MMTVFLTGRTLFKCVQVTQYRIKTCFFAYISISIDVDLILKLFPSTFQIVKYTAGGYEGFQAEVTYEGEAKAYEPAPSRNNNRYEAPRQTYEEPKQTYEQPKQTYQQPKQTYQQPKNTYEQPKQTYQRPQQTYEQPRRTYEQPRG